METMRLKVGSSNLSVQTQPWAVNGCPPFPEFPRSRSMASLR